MTVSGRRLGDPLDLRARSGPGPGGDVGAAGGVAAVQWECLCGGLPSATPGPVFFVRAVAAGRQSLHSP
jgi:hypothetical protein